MTMVNLTNRIFLTTSIILFNVLGVFGNANFLYLTIKKPQLRSKSTYLQFALSFCHIFCLLFELPNAVFLSIEMEMTRSVCFRIISVYIFFICAQAVLMLMLVIDLLIIIIFPHFYRTISNTKYIAMMLTPPFIYSIFTTIWGFLKMDDEKIQFCNPPIGLHPTVSRFWSFSNVAINTTNLIIFLSLLAFFYIQGKKQKRDSRKLMNRLKVSVIVFIFSWYMCMFGVDIVSAIGMTGDLLVFFQTNLILFALFCYTQSFYVILWRSAEYRSAFLSLWCSNQYAEKVNATSRSKALGSSVTVNPSTNNLTNTI